MNNKIIAFTAPGKAELLDCEMPQPKEGEVLIEIAISSISSGTERANLIGEANISRDVDVCKKVVFPRYCGYSSAGVVEAVGNGVTQFKPGDRVALSWSQHKKHICMPVKNVYHIGDTDFSEAAIYHIGTFPLAAIRKCRVEAGESAIVMGQGVLGQMAVKLLHAVGAVPVIAADPIKEKRERALALGADFALDPTAPDFAEQVLKITNGGANVAIEVTGVGAALDEVLDCMQRFGRVALLGCTRHSDFTIDYYHKVHGPGISLIGAHTDARPQYESSKGLWTCRDDVATLQKFSQFGRINFADMVEETYSPADAPEVFARLAKGGAFPFTQFDWRKL